MVKCISSYCLKQVYKPKLSIGFNKISKLLIVCLLIRRVLVLFETSIGCMFVLLEYYFKNTSVASTYIIDQQSIQNIPHGLK